MPHALMIIKALEVKLKLIFLIPGLSGEEEDLKVSLSLLSRRE